MLLHGRTVAASFFSDSNRLCWDGESATLPGAVTNYCHQLASNISIVSIFRQADAG